MSRAPLVVGEVLLVFLLACAAKEHGKRANQHREDNSKTDYLAKTKARLCAVVFCAYQSHLSTEVE